MKIFSGKIMWIEVHLCLLSLLTTSATEMLPVFLVEPESTVIAPHTSVTLPCEVRPTDARVRWKFNEEVIGTEDKRGFSFIGTNLHIADFKYQPKRLRNIGIYQCIAETPVGSIISRPARLSKTVLKRFHSRDDLDLNVTEGHNIVLPCEPPDSSPEADIHFIHNGSLLLSGISDHHSVLSTGILINSATKTDAGQYRCSAINPLTNQNKTAGHVINLHVTSPAQAPSHNISIVTSTTTFQSRLGQNITLECVATGNPQPSITWTRYGGILPEKRHTIINGNLFIWNMQHNDAGTYLCNATTPSNRRDQVKAIVLEFLEPPLVEADTQYVTVNPGEFVRLRCKVTGPPTTEVIWYHNTVPIGDLLEVQNGKTATHFLTDVQSSDAGLYQCMCSNDIYGISYSVINVEVNSKVSSGGENGSVADVGDNPGSPDSGVSSGNHGKVDFPKKNRNKPNSAGRRRKGGRKGGRRRKNGRRKQNRRKKNNRRPPSDESASKVLLVPPTAPKVSQLSDTSVKLEWSVPANDGLKIVFFRVQYKLIKPKKSQWKTEDVEIPGDQYMYEVSNLKSEATYKFRIAAVYSNDDNKAGPNSAKFHLEVKPYLQPKAPEGKPLIMKVEPVEYEKDFKKHYALNVKWAYRPTKTSKIEGFFLHYKPFNSPANYELIRMMEPRTRAYLLTGLNASTEYSIKIQSYNFAGQSKNSTMVVRRTLGDKGIRPIVPPDILKGTGTDKVVRPITQAPPPAEVEDPSKQTTQSSSEMLYMILGIVLGVMMLLLIVFMFMCWWKQRQQRRMMDAMNDAVRSKFQDSSQRIYADSLRKKYAGMNGVNGTVSNGHLPNMYTKMNISVNPMSELDNHVLTNGHSGGHGSPTQYQNSTYVPNGSVHSHHTGSDNNFNKINRSMDSSLHRGLDPSAPCLQHSGSLGPQDCLQSPDSFGGGEAPACPPSPHSSSNVPSCFEQFRSDSPTRFTNSNRSCDQLDGSHDHLQNGDTKNSFDSSINSIDGASGDHTGNKHRRRRRRAQPSHEQLTRDQATNTDLSSNEGTIEFSSFNKSPSTSQVSGQRETQSTSPARTCTAEHAMHADCMSDQCDGV